MTMSNRVAVLNDGGIEQISPPKELFKYPENIFVGQFIGSHGMNVLEVDLLEFTEDTISVGLGGNTVEMAFDEVHAEPSGDTVKLGFRPERTFLNRPESEGRIIDGSVTLLESFGEETVASVDTEQGEINAVISSETEVGEGDSVSVSLDRSRGHVFSDTTGEILVHAIEKPKLAVDSP